jgi:hypothetical protein
MREHRAIKRYEAEARNTDTPFEKRRKFAKAYGFSRKSQMTPEAVVLALLRLTQEKNLRLKLPN